jgi:hypothetical protein
MTQKANNSTDTFLPSVTTFFATKKNDGNFKSTPLNEKYTDKNGNVIPMGYDTLMKNLVPGSSFYLQVGGTDKNGNTWYRLKILPPRKEIPNEPTRKKIPAKTNTEESI